MEMAQWLRVGWLHKLGLEFRTPELTQKMAGYSGPPAIPTDTRRRDARASWPARLAQAMSYELTRDPTSKYRWNMIKEDT